jgi:hypothetical protein
MNESLHGVDGAPLSPDEEHLRAGAETVQGIGEAGLQGHGVAGEDDGDQEAATDRPTSIDTTRTYEAPTMDEVPRLMPLLRAPTSPHFHKRDESITVYSHARNARRAEAEERTDEQKQLLEDIATMKRFAPYSTMFEDVYTPEELHPIAEELRKLSSKNRPDFNDIEGKIVDVIEANPGYVVGLDTAAVARRVHAGQLGRTKWENLVKMASGAVGALHSRLMTNPNWAAYVISVQDPDPKEMDLTSIYQFAASSYANEVLGSRNQSVQGSRRDAFEYNCAAINNWREANSEAIGRLPATIPGADARFPASWELDNLIDAMNKRWTGEDRTGKFKNYTHDPQGAINLQRRIGHLVDDIRSKLTEAVKIAESEIVPLDAE